MGNTYILAVIITSVNLCIGTFDPECQRQTFEKVAGMALYGFNNMIYEDLSLDQCKQKCIEGFSDGLECLSFDYNERNGQSCYLSSENSHTEPDYFGKHHFSDYYEKICDHSVHTSGDEGGCKRDQTGIDYTGTISTTVSGRTCQRWDSQEPHEHKRLTFPDGDEGYKSNYCRNPPDLSWEPTVGGPWCYTTDENVRWEFCHIPECHEVCDDACPDNACAYEENGPQCFLQFGKHCNNKFCSSDCNVIYYNDDGATEVECTSFEGPPPFTTECLTTSRGTEYMGNLSVTVRGKTCQRWDSQYPHEHHMDNALKYPDSSINAAENYCRNPDSYEGGLWCYTTDVNRRWDECYVPDCASANHCKNKEVMHGITLGKSDNCYKFHWDSYLTREEAKQFCAEYSIFSVTGVTLLTTMSSDLIIANALGHLRINSYYSGENDTSITMWYNGNDEGVNAVQLSPFDRSFQFLNVDESTPLPFVCEEIVID